MIETLEATTPTTWLHCAGGVLRAGAGLKFNLDGVIKWETEETSEAFAPE